MIGAGTFINPLIKIVTTSRSSPRSTSSSLKPALDTSEDISSSVNESIGRSFEGANDLQKKVPAVRPGSAGTYAARDRK